MPRSEKIEALLERLQESLEEKDEKISELEEQVEELENQLEGTHQGWSRHRKWEEKGLPIPRLEMHWSKKTGPRGDDFYDTKALFVLVYRHHTDTIEAIPFGQTGIGGRIEGYWQEDRAGNPVLRMPHRDGFHIVSDAKQLGLRAFVTTDLGDVTEIDLNGCKSGEDQKVLIRKS